jgi:HTH-type transcriptional regulator, sugar sensing transcriptional regulator
MVASSKTMDALRTIGLNKYERNLWAALLSRGSATAGELADISNVPRSRCYDVLESLAERGFVVVQPGKPLRYMTVQPKEALERAKKKIQENANEMSNKIDRLAKSSAMKELERLHKDNIKTVQPEHLTGALRGRHAMHNHIESMIKKAGKSVKLITTEAGLNDLHDNHINLIKKVSASGVKFQFVAPITDKNMGVAKILSKHAQVKDLQNAEITRKFAGRLFIVDSQEFVMGLTDDSKIHPTQDVALWTHSNHVTSNFLEPVFDMVWQNSKNIK